MYDLLIKNTKLVRPNQTSVEVADIAISGGKVQRVAPSIPAEEAKEVHDAKGLLAFPGLVDGHMHVGIYSPLAEDAITESKAAAMGARVAASKASTSIVGPGRAAPGPEAPTWVNVAVVGVAAALGAVS